MTTFLSLDKEKKTDVVLVACFVTAKTKRSTKRYSNARHLVIELRVSEVLPVAVLRSVGVPAKLAVLPFLVGHSRDLRSEHPGGLFVGCSQDTETVGNRNKEKPLIQE